MIGIYKIKNKINGKIYIGQSNDIKRRLKEHCCPEAYKRSRIPVDIAIHKYGKENFIFEVVEECSLEQLNQREEFWIQYYDSYKMGYNCSKGGGQQSIGSNNGRARLTEEDVVEIRKAYARHERQKEVYKKYKDKIKFSSFQGVWRGYCWKHIMPEVFTEENRNYYIYEYGTFKQMLEGMRYYHLPWYSKKYQRWMPAENITCTDYAPGQMRRGSKAAIDTQ